MCVASVLAKCNVSVVIGLPVEREMRSLGDVV